MIKMYKWNVDICYGFFSKESLKKGFLTKAEAEEWVADYKAKNGDFWPIIITADPIPRCFGSGLFANYLICDGDCAYLEKCYNKTPKRRRRRKAEN